MYTRCPNCRTTFSITGDQLEVRGGIVRCGECHHVFRADQQLIKSIPRTDSVETEQPATSKNVPQVKPGRPLPTLDELLWGRKRSRIKPVVWGLGNLLVLIVLVAQITYFFSTELGRNPQLRPHVLRVCEHLGCVIRPQVDSGLIELAHTRVAPHPRYADVLRLKATLINRASFSQAFPLIEVSLSNRKGELVGRRTYQPTDYLSKNKNLSQNMIPNVIVHAKLEITSPNRRADGFEIRLIADPKINAAR